MGKVKKMDLIDRQALLKQIDIDSDGEPGYYGDTWKFIDTIKNLPSATELSTNLAEVGTDCISREQAIDALRKLREEDIEDYGCEIPEGFNQDHLDRATFAIKQLPPIQPKIGKWIRTGNGSLYDHYECSECGKAPKWECMGDNRWKIAFTDYCPNCGADMREVRK